MTFVHHLVGGFDVPGVEIGVEKRGRAPVVCELSFDGGEFRRILGEFDGERLVVCRRGGDEFRQTDGIQETGRHACRECISRPRYDRQARP